MFLPLLRIVVDGEALLFHRNFDYAVRARGELGECLVPRSSDLGIGACRPGILEQNGRIRGDRSEAVTPKQNLLVEGDDQVGFVAPVGDRSGADSYAIAARAFGGPRRGLDFRRV